MMQDNGRKVKIIQEKINFTRKKLYFYEEDEFVENNHDVK